MLKLREFQCVKVSTEVRSESGGKIRECTESEQESEKADECLYVLESYVVFERLFSRSLTQRTHTCHLHNILILPLSLHCIPHSQQYHSNFTEILNSASRSNIGTATKL